MGLPVASGCFRVIPAPRGVLPLGFPGTWGNLQVPAPGSCSSATGQSKSGAAAHHTPLLKTNPPWKPPEASRGRFPSFKTTEDKLSQNAREGQWRAKSHAGELHTQRQLKRELAVLLVDLHGAFVCRGASGVDLVSRFVLSPSRCARGGALASSQRRSRTGGCSRPLSEWKCAARVRYRAL